MNAREYIAEELASGRLKPQHIEVLTAEWQRKHGLSVDGKPGPATRASLEQHLVTGGTPAGSTAAARIGIDVSHYQGKIEWQAVAASTSPKVEFAWIKASQGVNAPQPRFAKNALGAQGAGIPWGAYHWATPDIGDAKAEARDFAGRVLGVAGASPSIPCALDLEQTVKAVKKATLARWVLTWLDEAEQLLGRRPWVYSGPWFLDGYLGEEGVELLKGESLWVADYSGPVNDTFGWTWKVRQFSSAGRVPGIEAKVDLNRFEGSAADWEGFAVRADRAPQA